MGRQLAAVVVVLCLTPQVLYAQEAQPALLTVLHGGDRASALELPLRPWR